MWFPSSSKSVRKSNAEQEQFLLSTTPTSPSVSPAGPKLSPEELRDQTKRNEEFLRDSLEISDKDVRELALQTIGPALTHLLDPKRPVLNVHQERTKSSYHILESQEQDLAQLLDLGKFLLKHQPREAFGVLASTLLRMKDKDQLDDRLMEPLLQTCGQALQRTQLHASALAQGAKQIAEACVDRHDHLRDLLPLFSPPRTNEAGASPQTTREAFLRLFGADDGQCQLVQTDPDLCDRLDALLKLGFAVSQDENGLLNVTIPGREAVHAAAGVAERMLALKIPGTARLFAVLALYARGEGDTEIQRMRACCQALLQTPAGHTPSALWDKLAPRVCELAADQQLQIEDLKDFERAAQGQGNLNAEAQFCRQRIRLRLAELRLLNDADARKTLAFQLMNEIGQAHQTLRQIKTSEDRAITFMMTLCEIGLHFDDKWLGHAKKAVRVLTQVPD